MSSPEGDQQREYRAAPRTVVLEPHVAYHYYFAARLVEEGTGPILALIPSEGGQERLEVVSSEVEPFRLGTEQLQARHLRLRNGAAVHDVWVDEQGRVLRVELPGIGFRAERLPAGS